MRRYTVETKLASTPTNPCTAVKRHILRRYKTLRNPQRKIITPPVTKCFAPSTSYLLTSLLVLRMVKSGILRRYKHQQNPRSKTITSPVLLMFAPSTIPLLTILMGSFGSLGSFF
jgi:hypothetical protein